MADLYGSCACLRNQYTILIPTASTSLAQVYFDNSTASRKSQAAPISAWLRVPLDWYHSTTHAQLDDETHQKIRRSFTAPSLHSSIRRQFCGYCGTHLSAWDEGQHPADYLDVTLGSLQNESLEKLEGLNIIPDTNENEEEDGESENEGLVKGGTLDDEDHVPTNEESVGGVDGPAISGSVTQPAAPSHRMQNRGLQYFEEMVEHSRLGRIKRQKGGHTSEDGTRTVQWEVVEIGDDEPVLMETSAATTTKPGDQDASNKRQKMGS